MEKCPVIENTADRISLEKLENSKQTYTELFKEVRKRTDTGIQLLKKLSHFVLKSKKLSSDLFYGDDLRQRERSV